MKKITLLGYEYTHSAMLKYIWNTLLDEGIAFRRNKGFIELFAPERMDEKNLGRSLSYWISEDKETKDISDIDFLQSVSKTLGLNYDIWDNKYQKNLEISKQKIKEAIKKFKLKLDGVDREQKPKDIGVLDLSKLEPSSLSREEETSIEKLKNASSQEILEFIHQHQQLFDIRVERQPFLLEFAFLLYGMGYYSILITDVLPFIMPHHRDSIEVTLIEAHSLGSQEVGRYGDAQQLLRGINNQEVERVYVDYKTSLLSNLLRYYLEDNSNPETIREVVLQLTRQYRDLFIEQEKPDYYPAINYAYMVSLCQTLYGDDDEFVDITSEKISQIQNLCQQSILDDRGSDSEDQRYYAMMSHLEFEILQCDSRVVVALSDYLEEESPPISLLDRTMRQLEFYLDMTKGYETPVKRLIEKILDIMQSYRVVTIESYKIS